MHEGPCRSPNALPSRKRVATANVRVPSLTDCTYAVVSSREAEKTDALRRIAKPYGWPWAISRNINLLRSWCKGRQTGHRFDERITALPMPRFSWANAKRFLAHLVWVTSTAFRSVPEEAWKTALCNFIVNLDHAVASVGTASLPHVLGQFALAALSLRSLIKVASPAVRTFRELYRRGRDEHGGEK
jgi:hypothetical protein